MSTVHSPSSAPPSPAAAPFVLRAVRTGDEAALGQFLTGLSVRTLQQRFWSGGPDCLRIARRLASSGVGIGAVACDPHGTIIGHVECLPIEPDLAEVAVVVADDHQGRGIGTALISELAARAADVGIARFVAHVSPENAAMLHVFAHGFGAVVRELGEGECRVSFAVRSAAQAARAA